MPRRVFSPNLRCASLVPTEVHVVASFDDILFVGQALAALQHRPQHFAGASPPLEVLQVFIGSVALPSL